MRLSHIVQKLGARVTGCRGDLSLEISSACSDSREVVPGCLFCAMKGARLDGHDYIQDALSRGAVAVLAEDLNSVPDVVPCVQVREPYPVLGIVAEEIYGRSADKLRLLGITGTNGKTTSAYLLRALLRATGRTSGMIGTIEYDVNDGQPVEADRTTPTPFRLQNLLADASRNSAEYMVMEVSSHSLEQRRTGSAKFQGAIFTNLTQDHLDYHLSMENYYQAKKLLFSECLSDGAPAVINCDGEYGRRLYSELAAGNNWAFSFGEGGNVHCRKLNLLPTGTCYEIEFPDGDVWSVRSPLTGKYNAENTAGVLVLAKALGISPDIALEAVATCCGAPGRLQKVNLPQADFSVFVDYAHTDDALRNVLRNLKALPHNRLLAVFGCGGDRDRKKRPKMAAAVAELADYAFVTSDNPRTEDPNSIIDEIIAGFPSVYKFDREPDRRAAIRRALKEAKSGDVILIAGKGHEDYQEINGVKHHFNDVECVVAEFR